VYLLANPRSGFEHVSFEHYAEKYGQFKRYADELQLGPGDRHYAWKRATEDDWFREWPVPVSEFLHNPYYVGTDTSVRKLIEECMVDYFQPRWPHEDFEVLLAIAGLGSGKSFMGALATLYVTYTLGCIRQPQLWLKRLDPDCDLSGDAEIVLMNASAAGEKQASKIVFAEIFEKVMAAPFFQLDYQPYSKSNELEWSNRLRLSPGTSQWKSALGWNLFFFVVDEAAFGLETQRADYVKELFQAFNQRRRSRFGRQGGGCLLTSPGSEYAYVEVVAGEATDWDYTTKLWRACTWEAKEQLNPGQHVFLVDRHPDAARVLEKELVLEDLGLKTGVGRARRPDGSLVCWKVGGDPEGELAERAA
jgi:hypothetical protein